MAVAQPPKEATLRSIALSVYVPTLLFAIGQGAVIPIVALAAKDLGAGIAMAGLIVALRGIGILAFDVPAGWLVGKFGERFAMAFGTILVIATLIGSAVAPNPWVFGACSFLMGCAWSIWLLARLTYVSEIMPVHMRGRALSTLGGINRVGSFIGPFLGAGFAVWVGLDGAYIIHIITAIIACGLLLVLVKDNEGEILPAGHSHGNFVQVVKDHKSVFLTAGVGVLAIQTLRAARQVVLPLWADHEGLGAGAVSVIFGISMGMEMLLFYPAGSVMDKYGRKAIALPCLGIMSLGMLLLPLTHSFWPIAVVGVIIGFGNGLGSGIVMTLGADFSPRIGRAQFLGAWRVCGDLGTAGGPLVVAGATAAVTLGGASVLMAAVGALGAALIFFRMPETLQRAPQPPLPVEPEPAPTGGS